MTSKILRADGTTELESIKSVTYHESVNADTDLRPGCVASNYIEVTCFGAQSDAPDVGEALTYYQVVGETETLIGIFYAEPSIPTKNSYSFIAYDAVHKLDADFSSWLSAHQEDFPYTVYQLVSQACTISGVTLGTSSWDHSTMQVNAWYADSITCRNVLQYAAEIACKFVRCNTSGEIVFDWYKAVNANILDGITFIDGKYYKDDGSVANSSYTRYELDYIQIDPQKTYIFTFGSTDTHRFRLHEYSDSQVWIKQAINVVVSNTTVVYTPSENARYVRMSYPIPCAPINMSLPASRIYPTSGTFNNEECYAYKQDGLNYDNYYTSALARVAVHPVGEDEVAYYYPTGVRSGNTLDITNNALLYGASAADMSGIAQTVYDGITAVGQYRPFDVSMFPNECPFRSGQIVPVTDAQGVSFTTAIMSKVVTDSAVTLASTGREVYGDYALDTAKKLVQLAADIVRINKLKVDWAEIDQIFARDITVTGQLHSEDYSYTDGEIYANQGMGMDFGEKRYNTPNFGITPDGNVYAQGGKISGFNIQKGEYEEVTPSAPTYTGTGYTYADGYLEVTEDGTATFDVPLTATVGGVTKPLTRIVYQCYYGQPSSIPSTFRYSFYYLDSGDNPISGLGGMLEYEPYGGTALRSVIPNANYLSQSSSLTFSVQIRSGSACRIYYQYGNYYSLYTESGEIGTGETNVYVGDDGISVGEKIILTPDGNAKIYSLDLTDTAGVASPDDNRLMKAKDIYDELSQKVDTSLIPFAVSDGGTGQTGVEVTSTVSNVITASTNYTVTSMNFSKWGKVAQLTMKIKRSSAVTISALKAIATLKSGYRPVHNAFAASPASAINKCYVNESGVIYATGTFAANTEYSIFSTFILP